MIPPQFPRWKCHKEVGAVKIAEIRDYHQEGLSGSPGAILVSEKYPSVISIAVDSAYLAKHKPEVGGYFVFYEDGYQSFSPAKAFEGGYTRVEMNALELGAAVRAAGLAGK